MRRTAPAMLLLVAALMGTAACGSAEPTTPASTTPTSVAASPPTSSRANTTVSALPDVRLAGVNDPTCRSDTNPVVLLPGTFSTVAGNFTPLAAALLADGRCVFGTNYELVGVAPVRDSATTVAAFVDRVLEVTGAEQVDAVAFSQGGLVLRTALRLDGLAPSVDTAVLIAPTFHGTTSDLLDGVPAAACPACADQTAGSALLTELAAGGDLDGDVRYAAISSRDDTVVTPTDTQSPVGPPDRVRSLIIQDQCPAATVEHLDLPGDPGVIDWVGQALATDGRPDPSAYRCR
ncbi:MAG TPA: alpha/beta fold hydrolase [Nakamurella sp.]